MTSCSCTEATGTLCTLLDYQVHHWDAYLKSVGLEIRGRKERRAFRKLLEGAIDAGREEAEGERGY